MAEWIDLGDEMGGGCVPCSTDKKKKVIYYPSIHLEDKNIPKDFKTKVGAEGEMKVRYFVASQEERETEDSGKKKSIRLDIRKISFGGGPKSISDAADDAREA